MESLLDLACTALARYLARSAPESELHQLLAVAQRLDQTQALWAAWQDLLQASEARHGAAVVSARLPPAPPLPLGQQHAVLEAFAAACWQPKLLRLAYGPGKLPQGLASLPLVGQRLLHLELSAPQLWQLDAVASACPQLCCLSLRGCTQLVDASLAALMRCTSLRALDLGGLSALTDGAAFHVAHLPQLSALSLTGTSISDRAAELLTYGHRVRSWARAAGAAELPQEAAAWPAPPLEHLQLASTHVTAAGVTQLEQLPRLLFLDIRGTGIARAALAPVQRRFALQFVQAAVLSSSNAVAAAVVNLDVVPCRCGLGSSSGREAAGLAGSTSPFTDLAGWEAVGLRLLLHFDPAAGLAALLEPDRRWPPVRQAGGAGSGRYAGESGQFGVPGGRRIGFRQPRLPRLQGGRQPQQLAGSKRPQPGGYG